jgi:Rrf2 family protein
MKLITKNTDYAIRALLVLALADSDRYISARQISQKQKIPYHYLRQILQKLIKEKFVSSKEGGGGGFKLKKSPAAIKLSSVIMIFQGEIQLTECIFRKKLCHNRSNCVLRKQIKRIESLVTKEFAGITLKSLLNDLAKQKRR